MNSIIRDKCKIQGEYKRLETMDDGIIGHSLEGERYHSIARSCEMRKIIKMNRLRVDESAVEDSKCVNCKLVKIVSRYTASAHGNLVWTRDSRRDN